MGFHSALRERERERIDWNFITNQADKTKIYICIQYPVFYHLNQNSVFDFDFQQRTMVGYITTHSGGRSILVQH